MSKDFRFTLATCFLGVLGGCENLSDNGSATTCYIIAHLDEGKMQPVAADHLMNDTFFKLVDMHRGEDLIFAPLMLSSNIHLGGACAEIDRIRSALDDRFQISTSNSETYHAVYYRQVGRHKKSD